MKTAYAEPSGGSEFVKFEYTDVSPVETTSLVSADMTSALVSSKSTTAVTSAAAAAVEPVTSARQRSDSDLARELQAQWNMEDR